MMEEGAGGGGYGGDAPYGCATTKLRAECDGLVAVSERDTTKRARAWMIMRMRMKMLT